MSLGAKVVAKLFTALFLSLSYSACDSMSEPAVPASCAETGNRCQLPDGPVGVCQETACAAAESTPPCFKCTSQH